MHIMNNCQFVLNEFKWGGVVKFGFGRYALLEIWKWTYTKPNFLTILKNQIICVPNLT